MATQSPYQSPFLDELEPEVQAESREEFFAMEGNNPFISQVVFRDEATPNSMSNNPASQVVGEMLYQFSDPEFRDATRRFSQEIFELYVREGGDPEGSQEMEMGVEAAVIRQLGPSIRGYEAAIDAVQRELGARETSELNLEEVNRAFHAASGHLQGDEFEYFLGGLLKKAGKIVKGVVNTAKKVAGKAIKGLGKILPIGAILNKLKGLIKPLIQRVLKAALGHVPESLREPAKKLAGIFLGGLASTAKKSMSESAETQQDFGTELEAEMNEYFLGEVFVDQEFDGELAPRQRAPFARGNYVQRMRRLRQARKNFARLSQRMQNRTAAPATTEDFGDTQQDATTPVVATDGDATAAPALAKDLEENFLPAIMAAAPVVQLAAKTAIGIIGRPKVIKFLSGLVAKMISRFIGAEAAKPLSSFIVDRGLGLMGLEVTEEYRAIAPGYAMAQVAEDTVLRLAEMVERNGLTESELEDSQLLEFFAMEAFEQAAAANLPAQYLKPEVRETAGNGSWILLPPSGTHYYKKYSETRDITIELSTANAIASFGGETLGQFLISRKGAAPGKTLKARVHLYEAIQDTWLSRISLYEKNVPGLGSALEQAWSQIHPLTSTAAGMLLGSAGLGRDMDSKYIQSRHMIAPMQRFYFLEVTGSGNPVVTPSGRQSQFNLVCNEKRQSIALHLYLSESDAQAMAGKLRSGSASAIFLAALLRVVTAAENTLFDGLESHLVLIRDTELLLLPAMGKVIKDALKRYLRTKVRKWIVKAITKLVGPAWNDFRQGFISAADSSESGLTITFRATDAELVAAIFDVIDGKLPDLAGAFKDADFTATIRPGFHRD